ncbi:MAG: hypothetical protein ACYTKD_05330 [Planctomycetota bacterium]
MAAEALLPLVTGLSTCLVSSALGGLPLVCGGPQLFDGILAAGFFLLARRLFRKGRRRSLLVMCSVPSIVVLAAVAVVLLGERFPSPHVKIEAVWTLGMLGLFVSTFGMLLWDLLALGPGPRPVLASIAGLLFVAAFVFYIRSEHWYRTYDDQLTVPLPSGSELRVRLRGGRGYYSNGWHFVMRWSGWSGRKDSLKHGRGGGGGYFFLGDRLRGLGFGFFYRHAPYFGSDALSGPFLAVVIPYWFLLCYTAALAAASSGLLRAVMPYLRFSWVAIAVMLIVAIPLLALNLRPSDTYHYGSGIGSTETWGLPFAYYSRPMVDGETRSFMGIHPIWRQDRLMMDLLIIAAAALLGGLLTEYAMRWLRRMRSTPGGTGPSVDAEQQAGDSPGAGTPR